MYRRQIRHSNSEGMSDRLKPSFYPKFAFASHPEKLIPYNRNTSDIFYFFKPKTILDLRNTFSDNIILRNVRRTKNKETIIFHFDVTQTFFLLYLNYMESKSISGVINTCSNTGTTPAKHGGDDTACGSGWHLLLFHIHCNTILSSKMKPGTGFP